MAGRPEKDDAPQGAQRESTGEPRHSGYVAIVGHTNVGKSTLLNRLVGEKIAIVSGAPQTTRTRIMGILTLPGGQIVFLDTPGFHKPQHRLNRAMIETATAAMQGVDVLLWVVDATVGFGPGDARVGEIIAQRRRAGTPLFVVLSKVDLLAKPKLLPLIERAVREFGASEVYPVSAVEGDNIEALTQGILRALPPGPALFPDDSLTDQPERDLTSEFIREKILHHTKEEIPHATAVVLERWEDGDDGITRIDAAILVEREGQKGIVIGKGGEMLKRVGTEARKDIERLLGRQVGLRLWVKVREHWRDDARTLRSLGITGAGGEGAGGPEF